jgi:transposase
MTSAYSQDLRDRVIDAVIRGGMSRRAAACRADLKRFMIRSRRRVGWREFSARLFRSYEAGRHRIVLPMRVTLVIRREFRQ